MDFQEVVTLEYTEIINRNKTMTCQYASTEPITTATTNRLPETSSNLSLEMKIK